ncbi:DUF2550 family protein [Actinotalea sp.]|uniref:DUF2550 family protein n=1 Tax=Actinotalea sp. TaxID=1872145 RepID=UPI0035639A39
MEVLPELIGVGALALVAALVIGLFLSRQRALTRRVGSFVCAVRPEGAASGPWVEGVAQYGRAELRWWRSFSLAPRPRLVWPRDHLEILERTVLDEMDELGRPMIRARIRVGAVGYEIRLSSAPYAGMVSWVEAGPRTVGSSS